MNFGKKISMRYDFNDLLIEPAATTNINSRKEVNPFDNNGMLPLFTAPMDTVVDKDNHQLFHDAKINICFPRGTTKYTTDFRFFTSLSLDEFIKRYITNCDYETNHLTKNYVLIDIANGHMKKMADAVSKAKELHGNTLFIMAGNVASPEAYQELSHAGADAVRIGIGNGNGCFLDDTLVLTKSGYKKIQDIEIGDFVLTHTKEFKEVIAKTRYNTDEQIYKINDIGCTENHEYYVVNKKDKDFITDDNYTEYAFWIHAKNLLEEIHLLLEIDINV